MRLDFSRRSKQLTADLTTSKILYLARVFYLSEIFIKMLLRVENARGINVEIPIDFLRVQLPGIFDGTERNDRDRLQPVDPERPHFRRRLLSTG